MEYLYLRRKGQLPWGYEVDEFDPQLCKPIKAELDILYKGLEYLKGSSYREVATWISVKTGRRLSVMGLHKIAQREHDRRHPPTEAEALQQAQIKAAAQAERRIVVEAARAERRKRTEARRARKAIRAKKIREDKERKAALRGPGKLSVTPRTPKQTLRDRRRSTLTYHFQAK